MPRLPSDILRCVLDHLQEQTDRFNMLLVCMTWYHELRLAVWSSISILDWKQLRDLTQSIWDHAYLDRLVHELRICGLEPDVQISEPDSSTTSSDEEDDTSDDTLVEWTALFTALWLNNPPAPPPLETASLEEISRSRAIAENLLPETMLPPPDALFWRCRDAVRDRDVYHWLLITILLLPNLRKLEISAQLLGEHMETFFTIFRSFYSPNGLSHNVRPVFLNLEQIRIINPLPHWNGWNVFYASACLPLLNLPALRVLHLDLVLFRYGDTAGWLSSFFMPAPGTLALRELHIRTATRGIDGIEDLIIACQALVVFSFQLSCHKAMDLPDPEVDSRAGRELMGTPIRGSLLRHAHSLQTLRYNDRDAIRFRSSLHDRVFWFGSMREFTALDDLRIRYQHLVNLLCPIADILPPALKCLTITGVSSGDLNYLSEILVEYLGVSQSVTPKLASLTVEVTMRPSTHSRWLKEAKVKMGAILSRARGLCRDAGIRCEVKYEAVDLRL